MNAQGTTMANNAVHVEQERYLFMSFLKGAQTVRRPAQIPRTAIIFKMTIGDQPTSQDQPTTITCHVVGQTTVPYITVV
jgi:hypothetical protein